MNQKQILYYYEVTTNYRKQFALHSGSVDVMDTAQCNRMSILIYHTIYLMEWKSNAEITISAPFNEHELFFTTQPTVAGGCWYHWSPLTTSNVTAWFFYPGNRWKQISFLSYPTIGEVKFICFFKFSISFLKRGWSLVACFMIWPIHHTSGSPWKRSKSSANNNWIVDTGDWKCFVKKCRCQTRKRRIRYFYNRDEKEQDSSIF